MKVVLINPPVRDFYNTPSRRQPLGLLYLAGALKHKGHEVVLIDAGASRSKRRLEVDDGDALDSSPFKLFGRFYHFGPEFEEIAEQIRSHEPQVVGISSLFNAYAEEALACAQAAREAAPRAAIVLGGGYPSSQAGSVLDHRAVDFTVSGEGEKAFSALVDTLDKGGTAEKIPGVTGRAGAVKAPVFTERIEDLPRPARELLDLEAYRFETQILSSRGCPHRCAFCSTHLTMGRTFRPRAPETVVQEMADCVNRFGVRAFDFEDDNLVLDPLRAEKLMESIIHTFGEDRLHLTAMNGISMRELSPRLLRFMRRAGFRAVNLSPLSLHPRARCDMQRPEERDIALSVPEQAAEAGLEVTVWVMIGFPGLCLSETMQDIAVWSKKPVLLTPSVFYPAPGSKIQRDLYPLLSKAGPREWAQTRSSLFPEVPGGPTRRELRTMFWMTRMTNFARSVDIQRCEAVMRRYDLSSPFHVKAALDAEERGLAALVAYLANSRPHGIRLVRRGNADRPWTYEVFRLEEMIEDPTFYITHGIPGYPTGIMERLRRRV